MRLKSALNRRRDVNGDITELVSSTSKKILVFVFFQLLLVVVQCHCK